MKLEGPKVTAQKSVYELCENLSDIKNFEKLMPEGISNFKILDEKSFIFQLKGMPEFELKLTEIVKSESLTFKSGNEKVPFTLKVNLDEITTSTCGVKLDFEGEFNAMMAMMVKGPISKFLETLSNNIHKL